MRNVDGEIHPRIVLRGCQGLEGFLPRNERLRRNQIQLASDFNLGAQRIDLGHRHARQNGAIERIKVLWAIGEGQCDDVARANSRATENRGGAPGALK